MKNSKEVLHRVEIMPDHADGLYRYGETAHFQIRYFRNGKLFSGQKLQIHIHHMDLPVKRKNVISFVSGKNKRFSLPLAREGSTILDVYVCGKNSRPLRVRVENTGRTKYLTFSCGVLTSAEKSFPAVEEPEDFEKFWEEKKKELKKVPLQVLEKIPVDVPEEQKGKFLAWDMKIRCAGPRPVSGYLTMPADVAGGKRKVPVIVSYHGGGVRSSLLFFTENAISFNVNAHGIQNGKEPAWYLALSQNELFDYIQRGKENREEFYFKYMYLRLLRAQEFVRTLPQWNRKDLILTGGSQGGAQTLIGAAMDQNVTLAHAWVPALCNLNHYDKNYSCSWPCPFYYCEKGEQDFRKVEECVKYFDVVHFARRIQCEVFMAAGLLDRTCPPGNVYAAYNVIPSKKKYMYCYPEKGHLVPCNPHFAARLEEVLAKKS